MKSYAFLCKKNVTIIFDIIIAHNEIDINGSLEGLKEKTLDEIYDLYAKHSLALRFSIHKSTRRMHSNDVVEKHFVF